MCKSRVFLLALVFLAISVLVSCSQKERITPHFASTFLSGSEYDESDCIAVDEEGYVYVGGDTNSLDFPTTPGVYSTENNGSFDLFIAKLSNDLKTLLALTLIGGSKSDAANSIKVDRNGDVFVAGYTESPDFPTTSGAFDREFDGGPRDAFLIKLDNDLKTLKASTFLGGSGNERDWNSPTLRLDAAGNVYMAGITGSSDFPVTANAYDTSFNGGDSDVFVAKFDSELKTLLAATFLGGKAGDRLGNSLVLSPDGMDVYIAGYTMSEDFPTTKGAFEEQYKERLAAFVSKFDAGLEALSASTLLGAEAGAFAYCLDVDKEGNVYVGGHGGMNYPTTPGVFLEKLGSMRDGGTLSKLNSDLTTLLASTFLGGSVRGWAGPRNFLSLAVDEGGTVYGSGWTGAINFPATPGTFDETHNGATDVFIARFSSDLKNMLASTLFGGSGRDRWNQIVLDKKGKVYVAGETHSQDFPTSPGVFQEKPKPSDCEVFVLNISKNLQSGDTVEIHEAAKEGNLRKIKNLLKKDPGLLEKKDKYKRTSLHWAGKFGLVEVTEYLLEENAQVNVKDERGNTPAHLAAMYNNRDVLEILISRGTDLTEKNDDGDTALHLASKFGSEDTVGLLLSAGAEKNLQNNMGDTPVHLAVHHHHSHVVELLTEQGAELEIKNNDGETPLNSSTRFIVNIRTAETLLKAGASVNKKNNEGKTPFHYAGDRMNRELIHLLFSYNVDLNVQDNEGKTPLHYAVVRGPRFIDLIEEIVEKGADFTIKDKKGKTPLDIASDAGHKDIVELFQKKRFP